MPLWDSEQTKWGVCLDEPFLGTFSQQEQTKWGVWLNRRCDLTSWTVNIDLFVRRRIHDHLVGFAMLGTLTWVSRNEGHAVSQYYVCGFSVGITHLCKVVPLLWNHHGGLPTALISSTPPLSYASRQQVWTARATSSTSVSSVQDGSTSSAVLAAFGGGWKWESSVGRGKSCGCRSHRRFRPLESV